MKESSFVHSEARIPTGSRTSRCLTRAEIVAPARSTVSPCSRLEKGKPCALLLSMTLRILPLLPFLFLTVSSAEDWPWWRGPERNGVAEADQNPPTELGDDQTLWSTDLPGRSHGSAIVVGDDVMLAVADEEKQTQSLVCLDRGSGTKKWS